jgi:hypothetical protein
MYGLMFNYWRYKSTDDKAKTAQMVRSNEYFPFQFHYINTNKKTEI